MSNETARLDVRSTPELKAKVDEVCDALGPPWTRSDVVKRVLEIFLADGVERAVARIKAGAFDAASLEELTRMVLKNIQRQERSAGGERRKA